MTTTSNVSRAMVCSYRGMVDEKQCVTVVPAVSLETAFTSPKDSDEWLIVLNSGDASAELRRRIQLVPSLCARWESIRTTIGSYGKSLYREGRLRARRTSSSSLMCGWQWRSPARNFGGLAARNLGFLVAKTEENMGYL
jgi:hypothetical protein